VTRNTPAPMAAVMGTGNLHVSAGKGHTVVLRGDGSVWAVGYNEFGQLGYGSNGSNSSIPAPMADVMGSGNKLVAAGDEHTAVLRSDGSVWTVGRNQFGQLGDGGSVSRGVPSPMTMGAGNQHVAAGNAHTVVLSRDGSVWAVGNNEFGQLVPPPPPPLRLLAAPRL
jgi:alpha-tubulin suppressor-like RCC1 family protein